MFKLVLLLIGLAGLIVGGWFYIHKSEYEMGGTKNTINAFAQSQEIYFREFKKLPTKTEDGGFTLPNGYQVFNSISDMPVSIREKLSPSTMPFVSTSGYRLIVEVRDKNIRSLWLVESGKLPLLISFNELE